MTTSTLTPPTKSSTPRLSEEARHFVIPEGIVTTGWFQVDKKGRELGFEFDWWQDSLGRAVLGRRADGKYAATVGGVVLSIPRQVGKTWFLLVLMIVMCICFPGLRVLWTAHHNRTSTNSFRKLQSMCRRKAIASHVQGVRVANGEQEIQFQNGSIIMFGAREHGFGRGFDEIDVEVFDEGQILSEKALEDMVAATNQARHPHGALLFYMGTPPRPADQGEVFSLKRSRALSGKTTDMVYLECSADDDADPDDQRQWAKANFSFPKHTPLESMMRLRENLGSDEGFLREGLGVWARVGIRSVIDADTWALCADETSRPTDRFALAIDISPDRSVASVGLAGQRIDGSWHVELDETRNGTGWITPYIVDRCQRNDIRAVVIDAMSPAASLVDDLKFRRVKVTVSNTRDMAHACGTFYDGAMEGWLHHIDQPQLNLAVSVAGKRPLLDSWAWNRKTSASDITPLVACTLALWGAQSSKAKKPVSKRSNDGRRAVVM